MSAGRIVVYGGKGALGSTIVKYFKEKNWSVGSIDFSPNENADYTIVIDRDASWEKQTETVMSELQKILDGQKLDAILNVAGGWAGGNIVNKAFQQNCELTWKQTVWTSTISAQAAGLYLKEGGFLALPGAQPAINGTPGMIGYGMSKAAVHQLTKSLGESQSGMPPKSTAVALLPVTLDTPMNRKWMPKADQTAWTSLEYVADLLLKWVEGVDRPKSGSLVEMITANKVTKLIIS